MTAVMPGGRRNKVDAAPGDKTFPEGRVRKILYLATEQCKNRGQTPIVVCSWN